jgi:hypothetical protein
LYNTGTFNMTGGEISGNVFEYDFGWDTGGGGGVYSRNAVFTMAGGEISGNSATLYGGGVYIHKSPSSASAFEMSGDALITNNTARDGAGVYNIGTMTLRDNAEISENDASTQGGGIYNVGILDMYGGEISNNTGNGVRNTWVFCENAPTAGTFTMYGGKIYGNSAYYGGGVQSSANMSDPDERCEFYMKGGEIYGNTAEYGGGVYNDNVFVMTGGIIGGTEQNRANKAYGAGGVYNCDTGDFTLSGDAVISGNEATSWYGGGVYNWGGSYLGSRFTMTGGEIYGNEALWGGGVANRGDAVFTMNSGDISDNKARFGGGVHNSINSVVSINSGKITGNTATGTDITGSGGGIYAADFSKLTVAAGVIFSGNTALTLRTNDIADNADIDANGIKDVVDYNNSIGAVTRSAFVLSALAGKNAPAYNNYDINYPGDSYVVTIDIDPEGSGSVTVKNTADSMTVYGVLTENGYVLVPIAVASITFSADAAEDCTFLNFVKDETDITDNPLDIPAGNMHVAAVFENVSLPPAPPVSVSYTIVSSARDGASISPTGNISVLSGGNMTFAFSAKSGYRVSAVYADGSPVSAEALASGTYTFYNVQSSHTIEAIGTPYASSPEEGGSESGGEGTTRSAEEETPGWAVLNLVFALIAIAAGIFAVIAGRNRSEEKDNNERKSKRFIPKTISLILGTMSVIVFFVTEDISLPPILADVWTVLMLVLMLAVLVSAFVSFRYREEEENI